MIKEPGLPAALRIYAIGDIHGCLDQLRQLMQLISEDRVSATGATRLIFLGDYIDRGLYSKQTIDFLLALKTTEDIPPIFLMGNHEQVMRSLLRDNDPQLLANWFSFGGRETLMSYGINPVALGSQPKAMFDAMEAKVPKEHVAFLDHLELSAVFGDYFFCHAGVKPGASLEDQSEHDLTWIRHEFLNHTKAFPKIIVHGHTISSEVQFMSNRIGIDTGAYATGQLTALVLEGSSRRILQTG